MFSRYFIFRFFRLFFLILISSLVVFIILDFVGNIQSWLQKESSVVMEYYWNFIPHIIYLVMPINILLAVTGTVGGMARHLEWAAMKTAGQSILTMMRPLVFILMLITLCMYLLGEKVLPDANHKRLQIAQPKNHISSKQKRDKAKYQFAYISDETRSYFFKRYSSRTFTAHKPTVLFFDGNQMVRRLDGSTLKWEKERWVIYNVWDRHLGKDSLQAEFFQSMDLAKIIPETPGDFIDTRFTPDEMGGVAIQERITSLKRSGEDTKEWETQWHFKYSGPFVNFIIGLIAIALSHNAIAGGLTKNFGIGLFLVFSYYVLLRVGVVLGGTGALAPWTGAWFANMIFTGLAALMIWRSIKL